MHPSHSLAYSLTRSHGACLTSHARRAATRAAHQVLRAVDKSNGFSLGGADCTRGPVRRRAPSTARLSERMDKQELCMHGD
jgi:hypothetical protein